VASGSSARWASGVRAKDSDRTATCQILDAALGEGQLSMAEHGERVKSATTAVTVTELQDLVADLQTDAAPATLREPRRRLPELRDGWGLRAAMGAVVPFDFTSDPGAKDDGIPATVLTPPRQLQSLGGLTGLFEQMRKKFGDTRGYELTIFSDYASLERPDPTEPRRVLSYTYRGGWDDPSESSVGSDARLVDLAGFDIPTMVGVVRGAPETLGIDPNEVKSLYLSISPNSDMTAPPESIEISVYVSPKFGNSGYIDLNGDGSIKRVSYPSS
jgi:hypothetical protein